MAMEMQQGNFRVTNKLIAQHVIGIPINSRSHMLEKSPRRLLPDTTGRYQVQPFSADETSIIRQSKIDALMCRMNKFAQAIRQHVRLSPKLTEKVKGKLSLGARILQLGGIEKVFKKNFNTEEGEKLLKATRCCLFTTAGPINGFLFISTHNVTFCSERSLKLSSPTGKLVGLKYKVVIPISKLKRASESENSRKPSEKYIEVVTEDKFDFWFMGFPNHQRTLKFLQQIINQDQ